MSRATPPSPARCPCPFTAPHGPRARHERAVGPLRLPPPWFHRPSIKRLDAPYVPNGRREWLKLKTQVIPGLGDTITVGLIGARFGIGPEGGALVEWCFGALLNPRAVSTSAEAPAWAWLFNSAIGLPRASTTRLSDDCLGAGCQAV